MSYPSVRTDHTAEAFPWQLFSSAAHEPSCMASMGSAGRARLSGLFGLFRLFGHRVYLVCSAWLVWLVCWVLR